MSAAGSIGAEVLKGPEKNIWGKKKKLQKKNTKGEKV